MASPVVTLVHPVNGVNIGVPYVAQYPTMHKLTMLSSNLLIVNTPFIASEWQSMLMDTPLFAKFANIPISICFSFNMGINTAPTHMYTPPNHNSALTYPQHVISHINNELASCQYSGPFSISRLEALIGPFCTSQLCTVPKSPTSPDDCQIVQDLSFPRNNLSCHFVNNFINVKDFRCDWGTFNDIKSIVMNAPDSTQAAT
jgi:hypothetical protein